MAPPTLIYCAGKNRAYDVAAWDAGFALGARLPATVYLPIYFADQKYKAPNRAAYMTALATHRPHMATVVDYERPEQRAEVLSWAEEAAQYVAQVVIIPKVFDTISTIPRRISGAEIILGYSVPTAYGGTEVPVWEFSGWPVHLLGGSPHAQMRLARYMDVVSADGNMALQQSHRCRFWRRRKGANGHWIQLREVGLDYERDNNLEAFRISCRNIMEAWHDHPWA